MSGGLDEKARPIQPNLVSSPQRSIGLGFSPCPNDTFMFHALLHGRVTVENAHFQAYMDDIDGLNRRALGQASSPRLPVTKVSASALAFLVDDYMVLRAGAALGRGVGPLVVAQPDRGLVSLADLAGKRVAVPGLRTTAYLLLSLFAPHNLDITVVRFEQIMPRVAAGEFDAGLIIHESRFTFGEHGLVSLADVGELWEKDTGLPLPLGLIVAKRDLGPDLIARLERGIADSVRYAYDHPEESKPYIRAHAQELSDEVCRKHIELYVNERSVDIGEEGRHAVETLLSRGAAVGLLPRLTRGLWLG
jgi:1,4-dihydroxy-6-naphthoate synthase